MGPFGAIDSVYSKFFTLKGRASRSEYWWFMLFYYVMAIVAFTADVYLYDPTLPPTLNPFAYFTSFWLLANIIPQFTVTIRRLHDSGKSGFWWLVVFIPAIGGLILFVLMVLDSEHNENYYGPPPFGPRGTRYAGNDLDDVSLTGQTSGRTSHNPYAAYAYLDQANRPPSAEAVAARKEEIRNLYQTRVLGKAPPPVPDAG